VHPGCLPQWTQSPTSSKLYAPGIPTPLISVSQHIQYKGYSFVASDNKAYLTYPSFVLDIANEDELTINISSANGSTKAVVFEESEAETSQKTDSATIFHLLNPEIKKYLTDKVPTNLLDTVTFQSHTPAATLPSIQTPQSAGFDVHSTQSATIQPVEVQRIQTDVFCEMPAGMYLHIAPRSSIGCKGIIVNGRVIDRDYHGEIQVILMNVSDAPFTVNQGDRIAQFIFEKHLQPLIIESDITSSG